MSSTTWTGSHSADLTIEQAHAYLTVVHGGRTRTERVESSIVIGRDPGARGFAVDDNEASRAHCEIAPVRELGVFRITDLDSKNGTYLDGERIEREFLAGGSVIRVGCTLMVFSLVPSHPLLDTLEVPSGRSPVRTLAETMIDLAAASDLSVLVRGPTGSGKERLAQRLHEASGRSGRLVSVNCAALSRELLSSELFGHVRGAFSGANTSRDGLFVAARGGTLFLDEVADMPLDQQPALLRALQEKRVRPVGSDREVAVDVRVVAAAQRDVEADVDAGVFRADLYARLAGVEVSLPGLADRREEILPLFYELLGQPRPPLQMLAAEALLRHDWPANIRELQRAANAVRLYAAAVEAISLPLLPTAVQQAARRPTKDSPDVPGRARLVEVLQQYNGSVSRAAEALGMNRPKLYRLLRANRLDAADFRN